MTETIIADGGLVLPQIPVAGRTTTAVSGTIGISGVTLIFFAGSWRQLVSTVA